MPTHTNADRAAFSRFTDEGRTHSGWRRFPLGASSVCGNSSFTRDDAYSNKKSAVARRRRGANGCNGDRLADQLDRLAVLSVIAYFVSAAIGEPARR